MLDVNTVPLAMVEVTYADFTVEKVLVCPDGILLSPAGEVLMLDGNGQLSPVVYPVALFRSLKDQRIFYGDRAPALYWVADSEDSIRWPLFHAPSGVEQVFYSDRGQVPPDFPSKTAFPMSPSLVEDLFGRQYVVSYDMHGSLGVEIAGTHVRVSTYRRPAVGEVVLLDYDDGELVGHEIVGSNPLHITFIHKGIPLTIPVSELVFLGRTWVSHYVAALLD